MHAFVVLHYHCMFLLVHKLLFILRLFVILFCVFLIGLIILLLLFCICFLFLHIFYLYLVFEIGYWLVPSYMVFYMVFLWQNCFVVGETAAGTA